ncbi:D-xylose 1-dehydrogenase Gfo6 [Halorubrum kocurii]|uniref:Xylose dehydrogenase (NAD/NADP) n=1 Tax=Halorubrum kocurii JCM 14978 TaxID=1230456 RepID=M0PMU2_9EURY|nr:D-xylose 1-dehydrogenase Gfo6 [Halorubrum kocurii]EMA70055.1 xylose dehydrogenase (NAD/NADP) [Halorubrum kocurii JCM 14978]
METVPSLERFRRRDWLKTEPEGSVRFALVGLGSFTREWIIPALERSTYNEATCLVSGDAEKADRIAEEHGVGSAVTYEGFLDGTADDSYDAVYIATPNALHLPYAEHAAANGKHVLCEKPMEATADRAREMVETCEAAGVTLMVAYRLQFNPTVRWVRSLLREGTLGMPVHVRGAMSQDIFEAISPDPNQWRLDPELSGGAALADLGLYPLNTSRFLLDADPTEVTAQVSNRHDAFEGVDESIAFTVSYDDGTVGAYTASQRSDVTSHLHVTGTAGTVRLEPTFFGEVEATLQTDEGTLTVEPGEENEMIEEFDYFASRVLTDVDVAPDGRHGLEDMRTIERLYRDAGLDLG